MNIIIFTLLASLFVCIFVVAHYIDKLEYRVGQLENRRNRKGENTMNIVIDIETLGRRNDAAITQIGVVVADGEYNIKHQELISIDPKVWNTCDRTFTGETLLWWLQQKNTPAGDGRPHTYKEALDRLDALMNIYRDSDTLVFTKGTMDLFCLKDLYEYFNEETPWYFWQPRDIRSIKMMNPDWKIIKENTHNALEDALNELRELQINLKKINNMQERQITITLDKAKEWYNSDNATLKEVALQAFSEKELNVFDFTKIKTFEEALLYLYKENYNEQDRIKHLINITACTSKASAAIFKLNIVRKALNTGYNLHLTKNVDGQNYTWYPYIKFITKDCTCYNSELKNGIFKKIGKITSEGVTYDVLGGYTHHYGGAGLGDFYSDRGVGDASTGFGFLGCATEEIAKHFSLHFGMLILEAMYGDMIDFQIVK